MQPLIQDSVELVKSHMHLIMVILKRARQNKMPKKYLIEQMYKYGLKLKY